MSISGQQTINIGLPNESTASDSLYTAFTKSQENFTQLFTCASPYTNFVGGTGISTANNASNGTVTITNTGVTSIIAGTNVTISSANGAVTISATGGGGGGGGTVTSVGLAPVSSSRLVVTNSPIVSSGTIGIDLATSGATAGTYTNPNVTVDTYGRVTSISSGPASGTVTSVGLTAGPGVQINGGPVTTSGNIVVTNTGVLKLTSGTGINLTGQTGNITVSLDGSYQGTVTSVGIYSTSLNVTSSPVTTSGTIRVELPDSPSVAGTFTAGNLTTAGTLNVTGTSTFGNIQLGNSIVSGNISAGNVYANSGTVSASLLAGTLTTAAQPNITSVGTLGTLTVTGNISGGNVNGGNLVTANYFTGSGQYLTAIQASSVTGVVAAASNATRVLTALQSTGTYYLPFISATAGANYSLASNSAFSANLANGALTATTFVGSLSGTATSATTAGTVTASAQSSITSVGTLSSLTVAGNIAAGNANLGNLVKANYFQGDGSLLSNITVSAGTSIVNGTSNVSIDTNGNIRSSVSGNANVLVVTGTGANITGTLNATGNANVGNIGTNNVVATSLTGTVATATQTSITSVGTLTGLTVGGAAAFNANIAMSNNYINMPIFSCYKEYVTALSVSGSSQTLDLSTTNVFNVTLSSNTTLVFANPPASGIAYSFMVYCKQDATGGRVITWGNTIRWPNGSVPVNSTGANKIDVYNFFTLDGGATYIGALSLANM